MRKRWRWVASEERERKGKEEQDVSIREGERKGEKTGEGLQGDERRRLKKEGGRPE